MLYLQWWILTTIYGGCGQVTCIGGGYRAWWPHSWKQLVRLRWLVPKLYISVNRSWGISCQLRTYALWQACLKITLSVMLLSIAFERRPNSGQYSYHWIDLRPGVLPFDGRSCCDLSPERGKKTERDLCFHPINALDRTGCWGRNKTACFIRKRTTFKHSKRNWLRRFEHFGTDSQIYVDQRPANDRNIWRELPWNSISGYSKDCLKILRGWIRSDARSHNWVDAILICCGDAHDDSRGGFRSKYADRELW